MSQRLPKSKFSKDPNSDDGQCVQLDEIHMTDATIPIIFDGHNDALYKQMKNDMQGFAEGYDAHIDLPKAKIGGYGGGFFAIWSPDNEQDPGLEAKLFNDMQESHYSIPLPDMLSQQHALEITMKEAAILTHLETLGALKICTTVKEIRTCFQTGTMAAIFHMEGAEAIDTNFDALHVLHRAGLRSLGPVWSRPTVFGHGVPFKFPSTGDTGLGLTPAGFDLIKECNALGIMLDMSHLNEAGFWDVVKTSNAPIVATHSNANAICASARNLTDDQLAAIKDSDGMVGLNFATAFLRPDGKMIADTGIDVMLRHLDHLIEHLGENRVGLGSDFDGALVPSAIGDCAGLSNLRTAMRAHGYDEDLLAKICNENWLRVLEQSWK